MLFLLRFKRADNEITSVVIRYPRGRSLWGSETYHLCGGLARPLMNVVTLWPGSCNDSSRDIRTAAVRSALMTKRSLLGSGNKYYHVIAVVTCDNKINKCFVEWHLSLQCTVTNALSSPSRILRLLNLNSKIKQTPHFSQKLTNLHNCRKMSTDFGLRRILWLHRNAHSKKGCFFFFNNGMYSLHSHHEQHWTNEPKEKRICATRLGYRLGV